MKNFPYKIATTSFVYPSTIEDNCVKLEKLVDEVSLVFFETKSCLEYSTEELPYSLKNLALSYNVHLPLDLPWEEGTEIVGEIILNLIEKVSFLEPCFYVLHPPPNRHYLLKLLSILQKKKFLLSQIYLENIKENNLLDIWETILRHDLYVCLDIGHVLEYDQHNLLSAPHLYSRVRAVHLYGPMGSRHGSLKELNKKGRKILKEVFSQLSLGTTVVIEVFNEKDLLESLDFLYSWIKKGLI